MITILVRCPYTVDGEPSKCEKCAHVICNNEGLRCRDMPQCAEFRKLANEQCGYPIIDLEEEDDGNER